MKFSFEECVSKIENNQVYTTEFVHKVIYQWVKQDKITPKTMNDLIIHFWKEMVY